MPTSMVFSPGTKRAISAPAPAPARVIARIVSVIPNSTKPKAKMRLAALSQRSATSPSGVACRLATSVAMRPARTAFQSTPSGNTARVPSAATQ